MRLVATIHTHIVVLVVALIVTALSGASAQTSKAATDQQLRDLVNKYMAGYASNTVEGYFDNYANDITYWWPNGLRQTREAYHKTWSDTLAGGNTVVSATAEDVRVHAAPGGDAGVASFIWKISRKTGDPYALQTSATWFNRNGNWQIVHMHFNRVAAPAARGAQPAAGGGGGGGGRANPPPPTPPAPPLPTSGAGKDVRDAVEKLTRAYGANDIETYFSFYAPELTWWGPNGRSDKETYRRTWTESVTNTGGLASADIEDLRIQVAPHNDLAVASYLLKVTRKNPGENRPPNVTYEMSPTLVKRGDQWQIVHLHFQVVPPRPAASAP
jgi:ketosteroid isomerase-like protein